MVYVAKLRKSQVDSRWTIRIRGKENGREGGDVFVSRPIGNEEEAAALIPRLLEAVKLLGEHGHITGNREGV